MLMLLLLTVQVTAALRVKEMTKAHVYESVGSLGCSDAGVIGSMMIDGHCVQQGFTGDGGLTDGMVCTGIRNVDKTRQIFEEPDRTFSCDNGNVFQNGVYDPTPHSAVHNPTCEGIIGAFFFKGHCVQQLYDNEGGLNNGFVCTGARDVELTNEIFDQPDAVVTCGDKSVYQNGAYFAPLTVPAKASTLPEQDLEQPAEPSWPGRECEDAEHWFFCMVYDHRHYIMLGLVFASLSLTCCCCCYRYRRRLQQRSALNSYLAAPVQGMQLVNADGAAYI